MRLADASSVRGGTHGVTGIESRGDSDRAADGQIRRRPSYRRRPRARRARANGVLHGLASTPGPGPGATVATRHDSWRRGGDFREVDYVKHLGNADLSAAPVFGNVPLVSRDFLTMLALRVGLDRGARRGAVCRGSSR